jgi:hypothetical protein
MFVTFEYNTFCKKSIVMQKMNHPILQLLIKNKWISILKIFHYVSLKWIGMFQTHVVIIEWWILCGEANEEFLNISQV